MGSAQSDGRPANGSQQGLFSLKTHLVKCPLRVAVEKNDFLEFQEVILKHLTYGLKIKDKDTKPSEYVATITSSKSDIGFVGDTVKLYVFHRTLTTQWIEPGCHVPSDKRKLLTVKSDKKSNNKVMLYVPCACPGRYAGMNINTIDRTGRTAMNVAIRKKDTDLVMLYIHCGVDINMWNKYGETPLHMASSMGYTKVVEVLIKHGADLNLVDNPPSHLLLKSEETPMMAAAANGHAMCIAQLLRAGALADLQDREGNTALHKASRYGNGTCVNLLLRHMASLNIRNNQRITALQLALSHRNTDIAKTLVKNGCDVTSYSESSLTILSLASMTGVTSLVNKCIEEGEDINKRDAFNNTALYYAFTLDNKIIRKLSLFDTISSPRYEINLQATNRNDVVDVLINHGADVEEVISKCLNKESDEILQKIHFTLQENIALFQKLILNCGFGKIPLEKCEQLFWRMLGFKSCLLAKHMLRTVPRLDYVVCKRLLGSSDWSGVYSKDAVYMFLEDSGSDLETSNFIYNRVTKPRTLQEWSRDTIRRYISSNVKTNCPSLPLPKGLKVYVSLSSIL